MLSLIFLFLGSTLAKSEEILFFNGNFLTDFERPPVSELLVRNGKVSKSGNHFRVAKNVKKIDLKGQWIIPSFIDSHVHLLATGEERRKLNLKEKSRHEILAMVQSEISKPGNGSCVTGFGWDQTLWPDNTFPERQMLDAISQDIPIILFRVDGHAAWANTFALKKSGLWGSENPQLKDQILKSGDGLPSGIVLDSALKPLENIIPQSSTKDREEDIRQFVRLALSLGITSIHDAGIKKKDLIVLKNLILTENIPFRFYEMLDSSDAQELKEQLKQGPLIEGFQGRLTVRTVKLFLDGAMGSRGALFSEPYSDDPTSRGVQLLSKEALKDQARLIDQAGFQVAIHAIGSEANHLALNAFEHLWGANSPSKRARLEHAQVLLPEDIKRTGRLGVIASMQPIHCTSDSRWVIDRIGKQRARYAYPWHSLRNEKVVLAFGSDSPIESMNPWPALFAAIQRRRSPSISDPAFFPQESISIREALIAFSAGGAFAAFQEKTLGSLTPGKWADFIVLARNPLLLSPAELQQFRVQATYFAGKKVFDFNLPLSQETF